jgi:arylsulfatase A-like enzyme
MKHSILPLSALLLLGTSANAGSVKKKQVVQKKPNILFILADDQRADAVGCAGNSYIRTPNIDALANNGIRFSNGYVMGGHHGAISAPSRAMLMTGKSLFHVYDKLAGVHTMPMHFAENGYETFGTGKWHNEISAFENSFQKGENVMATGMSDHFNVPCRTLEPDRKLSKPVIKGFSTDLFADAAIGYLNNYASEKNIKPFFCYVAFTAPHDPRSPRKDYIGMYPDGTIPLPGNFKALHPFEFDDMDIRDETLAPWPRTPEVVQQSLSDYYALITHMDNRIGDIIETLKKQGLYENTIIVYAADNGLAVGSHGLLGKQDMYEHSMKVPLIITGPGIPKNEVRDALVYLYDLFPTLSDLSHLPAPQNIDGKDLTAIVKGKEKSVRSSIYTCYRNTVRAVRTDEWKLIRYPQRDFSQLFNLKKDPLEIDNLAALPEYKQKLDELMGLLKEWYVASNDTANLQPKTFLPLEYDYKKLKRIPDNWQPEYIIERYFKGIDLTNVKRMGH